MVGKFGLRHATNILCLQDEELMVPCGHRVRIKCIKSQTCGMVLVCTSQNLCGNSVDQLSRLGVGALVMNI